MYWPYLCTVYLTFVRIFHTAKTLFLFYVFRGSVAIANLMFPKIKNIYIKQKSINSIFIFDFRKNVM